MAEIASVIRNIEFVDEGVVVDCFKDGLAPFIAPFKDKAVMVEAPHGSARGLLRDVKIEVDVRRYTYETGSLLFHFAVGVEEDGWPTSTATLVVAGDHTAGVVLNEEEDERLVVNTQETDTITITPL